MEYETDGLANGASLLIESEAEGAVNDVETAEIDGRWMLGRDTKKNAMTTALHFIADKTNSVMNDMLVLKAVARLFSTNQPTV